MSALSEDYLFVVAIDFGTTYSGYAFSSRDDFKKDPLKIVANQAWNAGSARHFSLKTPTCLLLNDNEELVSFGYEAENKYADIVMDSQQNKYYYFQRFKMQLYRRMELSDDMILEDITGKSLTAIKVFAFSIKALIQHLFRMFEQRGITIEQNEIRWVLTVPAIWSNAAKQFMRKSAIIAGIPDNQLLIALEPEAASIYCQYLPIEKLTGAEKGFSVTEDGTTYMVMDNGGGTADISVHQKISKGKLKEVCRASGGECGGTSVDNLFYQIFVKLFGAPLLNAMKLEDPSAYLDLFREFEAVKRTVDTDLVDMVRMTIPRAILDTMCREHLGEDISAIIESSPYKGKMEVRYDKMKCDAELIKGLFDETAQKIIQLVSEVLSNDMSREVSAILMVGGFSECKIIQDGIRARFPKKRVIVPEDPGLAVLKGAVLFGHKPENIVSRVVRYTYGIEVIEKFDPKLHDIARRMIGKKGEECRHIFMVCVKTGRVVELGEHITIRRCTRNEFQRRVTFRVFQSTEECPKYTNEESCTALGSLSVDIPNPTKERRSFRVSFIFGHTELKVTAFDVKSGEQYETVLDLL